MSDPRSLFDVKGRVALVTGASSGLGRRAATLLAEAGAHVIAVARRAEALEEWASGFGDQVATIAQDVARRDQLGRFVEAAKRPFGAPEILVHAAGVNTRQAADDVTAEGWDQTLALNLSAPFFISQGFVDGMKAKGRGRIVNFASLQSYRAFPGGIAYGASKGGVAQMTRAMAEAWSQHGINVNAIGPGFIRTELTAPVFNDPDRAARNAAQTCMGRNGEPEDLDGPLLFLCSDASAYVTGQILMVDGGYTAK